MSFEDLKEDLKHELKHEIDTPKTDVLSKIAAEISTKPKQADEFTAMELFRKMGIEYKTVVYRLTRLENAGVLTSRKPGNERFYRYLEGHLEDGEV